MPIINNFGGINKEIQKIDDLLNNIEREIEEVYFGDKHIFSVWEEYVGTLPAQFNANGDDLKTYKVWGNTGGVGKETVNLFDGEWLQGYYAQSGGAYHEGDTWICFKNKIPCKPNTDYTLKYFANSRYYSMGWYTENDTYISMATSTVSGEGVAVLTATSPANAAYLACSVAGYPSSSTKIYVEDAADTVLIEGSTAPESYVPYGYEVDVETQENLWTSSIEQGVISTGGSFSDSANRVRSVIYNLTSGESYAMNCSQSLRVVYAYSYDGATLTPVELLLNYSATGKHDFTFTMPIGANAIGIGIQNNEGSSVAVVPSDVAYKSLTTGNPTATPIYIGTPALEKDEYVDSVSGKVYRKKAVHEDTVTINGVVWDILGYDHDTAYKDDNTLAQHTVTIQTHDCIAVLPFDAVEMLYYCENGLPAGTYYFTIDSTYDTSYNNYSAYQFTLANDVPAGGILMFPWGYNANASTVKVSSYESRTATTAIESVSTVEGTDGTNLGEFTTAGDAANNRNSIQRARYGSNNWRESAMRQFLNSAAAAGSVWTPQTKFDRPPSWAANTPGFLRNVDPEFVSVLGNVNKITALNTISDGGGKETKPEKVFLLSRSEVYAGDETTGGEGSPYPYYKNYSDLNAAGTGADKNRIKYRNGAAIYWWLRSPYVGLANYVRYIYTSGALSNYLSLASNSYGVAPACTIVLDDIETNPWLQEKFLKPTDPPVPLPAIPTVDGTTIIEVDSTVQPEKVELNYRKHNF